MSIGPDFLSAALKGHSPLSTCIWNYSNLLSRIGNIIWWIWPLVLNAPFSEIIDWNLTFTKSLRMTSLISSHFFPSKKLNSYWTDSFAWGSASITGLTINIILSPTVPILLLTFRKWELRYLMWKATALMLCPIIGADRDSKTLGQLLLSRPCISW